MEFIDLRKQYQKLKNEIEKSMQRVLDQGHFIMGSEVQNFEEHLAEYVGVKHVISCGNGTDALQLIYMAYGIGEGDIVFCPNMTFIASIEPACLLGATPVFIDIDLATYNIDSACLEKAIIETINKGDLCPKAIVAVDFLGNPADYSRLLEIARKYNLLLIEDAAQGMGASYKGKKCGVLGTVAATSFFPTKPLGAYGDGGAVFTDDDEKAELFRSYRVHGKGRDKYDNVRIGMNSRLDALQAAVLNVKLKYLEREIEMRQEVARYYDSALQDYFQVPYIEENNISSYAQYLLLTENRAQRMKIREKLREENIPTILYYPTPMQELPVFQKKQYIRCGGANTREYCERSFAIPFSPYLSEIEQDKIIKQIILSIR